MRRPRPFALLRLASAALLFVAALAPGEARGQVVVVRAGAGGAALDRRLDRLLGQGDYRLVTRDTLIARGDSVAGSLLVLDATLTLEGTVAGDLVGVDADLFLRPTAAIRGDVVNVAGGLYRSVLATIGGEVLDAPLAPYRVVREGDGFRIEAQLERQRLKWDGFMGLREPTYDRVDALNLAGGGSLLLGTAAGREQELRFRAGYATGRGEPQGGAELVLGRGEGTLGIGAERVTETHDRWIRGDLRNSLTFLVRGRDYRNYYEADRLYARLGGDFDREAWSWNATLLGRLERARTLVAGDPWTLFGGTPRSNPPIDDGTIASLLGSATGEWAGRSAVFAGGASVEAAGKQLGGEFSFLAYSLWGEWAMRALADHTLEVEWRFQGPLPGTDSLPRQRWTFVGGSPTLYTVPIGHFRGDRLAFVRSEYIIPFPERLRLPLLGRPDLHLLHVAAMAWSDDERRGLRQNIGARLQFFSPFVRIMVDPADLDEVDLDVGLAWPFDRAYPWQRRD